MDMKLVAQPRARIILFFPRLQEGQYPLWAPLESFAIATAFMNRGYEVTLIDERGDEDPYGQLERALPGAMLVGFSTKLGEQLGNALRALEFVKSKRPDVPTMLGGWFPSLFPESPFESPFVDIVAIGPADFSAPEVADRILEGRSLEGIEGIWARENGQVVKNPFAHLPDIKQTHPIPWDVVGIARYIHPGGWINTFTSRGCPGQCNFCSIFCLDPRRWTAMEPERVVESIQQLYDLGVRAFKVMDTDFCADVKRVDEVARLLLERGPEGIRFEILGRHWNMRAMTDEQIRRLRLAGCTEIEMGVESGSQRLSDLVRKQLDVTEVPETARRFVENGIRLKLNFMFGIPTETDEELAQTLNLISKVLELGDDAIRLQLFRYTPVPGDASQDQSWLKQAGEEPAALTLEELAAFAVVEDDPGRMSWISEEHERDVRLVYYVYAPLAFIPTATGPGDGRPIWRLVLKLMRRTARWRIKNYFFRFPFEKWLNDRFGFTFRHGSDDGITPFDDVLPEPPMGDTVNPRPALEPAARHLEAS